MGCAYRPLVTVNAVFSGYGEFNPIPNFTCRDSEIWLNLGVIQPCIYAGFSLTPRRICAQILVNVK